MKIPPFKLEEFWKIYEFKAPYILCGSDVESWTLKEILALADEDCLQLWNSLNLGYTEVPGMPLLRKEIASLYTNMGPDNILTFAGAEEGIYCLMQALVNPGDHVIVIEPCYQSLSTLPEVAGGKLTKIKLNPEKKWKLNLDEIKKAFRPNTKLVVLNYPHNPTGSLLDQQTFEGIIELARKSNAYIFCDEVYRYLEINESDRLPSIADAYEKGISLNVMTKSFGLGGLRIGWIATQNQELLEQLGSYKLYTSICNSGPSEILALIALRAKEKILKRSREITLSNFEILKSFMKRNEKKLSWIEPKAGPMALIQLKLPVTIEKFVKDAVDQAGILVMPADVYDLEGNYFRVGFGKKTMPANLERFERFLNSYDAQ